MSGPDLLSLRRRAIIGRNIIRSSDNDTTENVPLPPEVQAHLDRLVIGFTFTKWFIVTYQAIAVGVLLLAATWRWYHHNRAWPRRKKAPELAAHQGRGEDETMHKLDRDGKDKKRAENKSDQSTVSSSSGTEQDAVATSQSIEGEDTGTSDEWNQLLERGDDSQQHALQHPIWRWTRWALMYQPAPIPVVNKVLPDNATTLNVLLLLGLNLFYLLFNISLYAPDLDILADRAGFLFVANLPWLYLFSAKNCPLKAITGHSYENLNLLHRRLGEWMCFLALIHLVGMIFGWYYGLRLMDWTLMEFLTLPYVVWGCLAWICYELLYVSSLGILREWNYELFLGNHVILQAGALIFMWLHHFNDHIYVGIALAIFLLDRILWRLSLKRWSVQAGIKVLEDGETVMVSADWPVIQKGRNLPWMRGVLGYNMQYGWNPSQHVFITVPKIGKTHALQAHPMTIASAAPATKDGQTHAWFNVIIRAKSGFSRDLLDFAGTNDSTVIKLDGPYGSMRALEMLRESQVAIIVAGGSGIAVAYPMLWDLLHRRQSTTDSIRSRTRQEICLIWIIQDESHIRWLGQERIEELKAFGLHVVIPGPSRKQGRPNVNAILEEKVEDLGTVDSTYGVVVSGPDSLNRSVRNCCARLVRSGREFNVAVEKFGW